MRFTILSLLVVTAIVAVFCVAFVQRTVLWVPITGIIAHCVAVWAAVKIWSSGGRQRAAWIGFTVASLILLIFSSPALIVPRYTTILTLYIATLADTQDLMVGMGSPQVPGEDEVVLCILDNALWIVLGTIGAAIGFIAGKPAKTE